MSAWQNKVSNGEISAPKEYELLPSEVEATKTHPRGEAYASALYIAFHGKANAESFNDNLQKSARRWRTLLESTPNMYFHPKADYEDGKYIISVDWPSDNTKILSQYRAICEAINAQEANSEWECYLGSNRGESPLLIIESPNLDEVVKIYNQFVTKVAEKGDGHIPLDLMTIKSPINSLAV